MSHNFKIGIIPEAREVRLRPKIRKVLEARCRAPSTPQGDPKRAQIVLLAAEGRSTRSIAKWRELFDEISKRPDSKVGLMKLGSSVPGDRIYAVAVRDSGLWLTLWVRRLWKSEFFVFMPRADGSDVHAVRNALYRHLDHTLSTCR